MQMSFMGGEGSSIATRTAPHGSGGHDSPHISGNTQAGVPLEKSSANGGIEELGRVAKLLAWVKDAQR